MHYTFTNTVSIQSSLTVGKYGSEWYLYSSKKTRKMTEILTCPKCFVEAQL